MSVTVPEASGPRRPRRFKGTFSARRGRGAIGPRPRAAGLEAARLPDRRRRRGHPGRPAHARSAGELRAARASHDPLGRPARRLLRAAPKTARPRSSRSPRRAGCASSPRASATRGRLDLRHRRADRRRCRRVHARSSSRVGGSRDHRRRRRRAGRARGGRRPPRRITSVLCDVRQPSRTPPGVRPAEGRRPGTVRRLDPSASQRAAAAAARPARSRRDRLRGRPLRRPLGLLRCRAGARARRLCARRARLRLPRVRRVRAVVTGEGRLDAADPRGQARLAGEIGTRARQAGVPAARDPSAPTRSTAFGKRIIDLMRVIEATDLRELEAAGEALGTELAEGLA